MNEQQVVLSSILPAFQIETLTDAEKQCIEICDNDDSSWDELHTALLGLPEVTKSIIIWASCLNERLSKRSGDFFAILTGIGRVKVPSYLWTALLFERMMGLADSSSANSVINHSILTSIIGSFIAGEFDELQNASLIPASLAHDMGHLLMPINQPRLRVVETNDQDECESNWARPETDHSELGALFLEAIEAPEIISLCAKEHHNISNSEFSKNSIVATVRCADIIAEAISLETTESQSNRCLAKLKNDFLDHPFSENIPLILTYLPEWAERGLETQTRMKSLLFPTAIEESQDE